MRSTKHRHPATRWLPLLGLALLLAGCKVPVKWPFARKVPVDVSQNLALLQQQLGQNPATAPSSPSQDQKLPWQSFVLNDREIFKPSGSADGSDDQSMAASHKIQLQGVVILGKAKAILNIDQKAYIVRAGDQVLDIIVHNVTADGIVLQRGYKRLALSVGQSDDL